MAQTPAESAKMVLENEKQRMGYNPKYAYQRGLRMLNNLNSPMHHFSTDENTDYWADVLTEFKKLKKQ